MKVRQGLIKYISPDTSLDERLRTARAEPLDPPLSTEDLVTVLFVLSYDRNPRVAEAARKSLEEFPVTLLLKALESKLDPLVIKKIMSMHRDNEAVLVMSVLNSGVDDDTLRAIAETGPEEVIAVLLEDREMLLEKPLVIEGLKKNPLTPPSVLNELHSLEAAGGTMRKPEPRKEQVNERHPLAKELTDERPAKSDEQNIYKIVQNMTMAQKIKLAITGNKSAREFLVKDTNKIISMAVLKNPRLTEEEVVKLVSSKGTPEDILRHISRNKEWVKNYNIKFGMVVNPKTPLSVSVKLLDYLYDKDLEKIAKSKNIPSVLASTARRKLETKKK